MQGNAGMEKQAGRKAAKRQGEDIIIQKDLIY
jgi:hypothetical protein